MLTTLNGPLNLGSTTLSFLVIETSGSAYEMYVAFPCLAHAFSARVVFPEPGSPSIIET
ncbi:MAG: hypothetical protein JRN26_02860 [Nitrososphaerota archaeon]|nr:hypothetical protein [Nitrososphaerota archaeon]MDG6928293.1 hypothetical protein [Nitrososphaerota archaeon]MDG6931556.1 hypothetical protein [Nitrososphaerota archaeon]MDG6935815.1 hypothetical protein [Nitrososphaerota archaeon]MDG6943474.1 hypothetical protein [Nitrososphaerota archaeon]